METGLRCTTKGIKNNIFNEQTKMLDKEYSLNDGKRSYDREISENCHLNTLYSNRELL